MFVRSSGSTGYVHSMYQAYAVHSASGSLCFCLLKNDGERSLSGVRGEGGRDATGSRRPAVCPAHHIQKLITPRRSSLPRAITVLNNNCTPCSGSSGSTSTTKRLARGGGWNRHVHQPHPLSPILRRRRRQVLQNYQGPSVRTSIPRSSNFDNSLVAVALHKCRAKTLPGWQIVIRQIPTRSG